MMCKRESITVTQATADTKVVCTACGCKGIDHYKSVCGGQKGCSRCRCSGLVV